MNLRITTGEQVHPYCLWYKRLFTLCLPLEVKIKKTMEEKFLSRCWHLFGVGSGDVVANQGKDERCAEVLAAMVSHPLPQKVSEQTPSL